MPVLSNLSTLIQIGLTATFATGIAAWVFKQFGEKWLSAKFNERLEAHKHAQQREIERLRFNISALLDRTTKLHQHEFEVLPQVWALLNDAFGEAVRFTSPLQSYPDLDRMEEGQLSEFLAKCDLDQWQKAKLATLTQRNTAYQDMIFWHSLSQSMDKYVEFNNYFIKNSIFLQPDLKIEIDAIRDMMSEAIFEKKFEQEYPQPRPERYAKCDLLRNQGPGKRESIGEIVQSRLWSAEPLDA